MNRYERPDSLAIERRPTAGRRWLWAGIVAVLALAIFAAVIGFPILAFKVKGFQALPPPAVSTATVRYDSWQPTIQAVGSLTADKGADLSLEVPGIVDEIDFDSGGDIKAGQQLLRLYDADEVAKLHTLEAARDLAQVNFDRDQAQLQRNLISQAAFDLTAANLKTAQTAVAEQAAIVAKKTLRAPFAGHLGLRNVNVGQYVNAGTPLVTLQALDPINFDFHLPQQTLQSLKPGQTVTIAVDAFPGQTFTGKIITIDPKVDPATRNIAVRAQFPNPGHKLLPGMFATAEIDTGAQQRFLTLPQTAITFNPYGNMVYVVAQGTGPNGKPAEIVRQAVVKTGETRGDQIQILDGLKEGQVVVSAGQLKLQNGIPVRINNAVQPSDQPNPHPVER
jgi:membrane fusion protein, multidrug efflux system